MPNWCFNYLTVKGSRESLEEFREAFVGKPAKWPLQDFEKANKADIEIKEMEQKREEEYLNKDPMPCFNALYPVPKEILDQGYSKAGYGWCIDNWGTKWDVYDRVYQVDFEDGDDELLYDFDTAWSPPIEWVEYVSSKFKDLSFEILYQEEGMCFCGRSEYKEGSVVEKEEYEYPEDRDSYINFVKEHFGEENVEHLLEDEE